MAPSASSPRSQTVSPHWDDWGPCQDMAVHWKLITKLVRFGSNVLQETAVSLRREELVVHSDVMTRVIGPDTVADKQLPFRNGSKLVFLCSLLARRHVVKAYVLSKRTCRMMSLNWFREMVPVISGFPRCNDQLLCSDGTLITPRKMITAINAISSGRATKQCSFFCFTC